MTGYMVPVSIAVTRSSAHMTRSISFAIYVGFLCLTGCVSTSFVSTWKAPDVRPIDPAGKKIAAVYLSSDEGVRRVAEDVLARKLNEQGAQGVAAYTLIPSGEQRDTDTDRACALLKLAGVDGVVIMREIGQTQKVTYTPGYVAFPPYYRHLTGYWGYGWRTVYEPGYLTTDTVVSVETLIYSLTRDELLWAGTSKTTNPAQIGRFVEELADAVAKEVTTQGLLAK